MSAAALLLLAPLFAAQEAPSATREAPPAAPSAAEPGGTDRWQAAYAALAPEMHAGLDFLLAHMPAADREGLDVALVVENVEYAYRARAGMPWGAAVPEEVFLNDVLPYALINERRDRWRKDFFERLAPLVAEAETASEAAAILNNRIWELFGVKYSTARPKADQSPYESIEAGLASCTGLTVLLADACRAVGVPARLAGTPLWADGSGNHSWVEVWDDGWHFTGAAEPTGMELDKGWFTDRAAQAVAGDELRAIYATSWKPTGRHFPMVWKRGSKEVHAVEVTARYVAEPPVPEGHGRLRFLAFGRDGERAVMQVSLTRAGESEPFFQGETHDASHDANDHLTAVVPLDEELMVTTTLGGVGSMQGLTVRWDDTRVVVRRQQMEVPSGDGRSREFSEVVTTEFEDPPTRLWDEHRERLLRERAEEMESKTLRHGEHVMPFEYKVSGEPTRRGRSLYISMHGGGGAPKRVNDQQWENQKRLYEPAEGVYVAPRAPTDTWNLWHQAHIDPLFQRLIEDMVVFEGVDPDRVYLMGYSAGGDGVYQLAPRMADRFAAAAMMAGHPNETKPDGLRNLPFTLHMGAEDAAFDRNQVAARWKEQLAALQEADPEGYPHWVEIHEGKGHWMDREDAAAVPWMAQYRRDRHPERIVWLQDDVLHDRFYWLKVDAPVARSRMVVEREGQVFRVVESGGYDAVTLRMDERMIDFREDVTVLGPDGAELFRGRVARDVAVLEKTLAERGTRADMWPAELRVELP